MSQEAETANTEHRPSRVRKWLRRFVVLSLLAGTGMAWAYNTYVINNPGPHISDQHIQSLLTQDSLVYYRDGKTVMSSITYQNSADDLNHRYYIAYDELPQHWINAIIAMEDQIIGLITGSNQSDPQSSFTKSEGPTLRRLNINPANRQEPLQPRPISASERRGPCQSLARGN